AAARQIVHRDLVGDAGLRRAEEDAAVAPPVRLRLEIQLEVAVLLVREQQPAAANRTLRAEDHAVQHMEVWRDALAGIWVDVPAGEIAAVEDRREAVRHLRRGRVDGDLAVVRDFTKSRTELDVRNRRRLRRSHARCEDPAYDDAGDACGDE